MAADRGVDARGDLGGVEGLGDVVVGPGLEPGDLVGRGRLGAEQDDRQARGGRVGAELAGEREAVDERQVGFEQDDAGAAQRDPGERLVAVPGERGVEAVGSQAGGEELRDLGVGVGDEDQVRVVAAMRGSLG
nr:hypothetical protein GCM10025732_45830 [Glycomyces mayteni]